MDSPADDITLAGLVSADMFVEGLKGSGPEFSRQKVIDYLNTLDHYTADGRVDGLDWTVEHAGEGDEVCQIGLRLENGEFVPLHQEEEGKPFICFDPNPTTVGEP